MAVFTEVPEADARALAQRLGLGAANAGELHEQQMHGPVGHAAQALAHQPGALHLGVSGEHRAQHLLGRGAQARG